jgi:SAM-dependent methyltransferase
MTEESTGGPGSFDQAQYWIDRHQQLAGDPRSVGNLARSLDENVDVERRFTRAAQVLAELVDGPKSILDLGCGYGRAAGPFLAAGYDYHGVDVSPAAIAQARERHPEGRFEVADLRTWSSDRRFGIVAALYVLVHFVADDEWRQTLDRATQWVEPSGVLVLAENFATTESETVAHARPRPRSEYLSVLHRRRFAVDWDLQDQFVDRHGAGGSSFLLARPGLG